MASRFPEIAIAEDSAETELNYTFDHLIACANKGRASGDLWHPHGVAIEPTTNRIYVAEGGVADGFARVSVFSESGEYLNSYTHEHMVSLWGIAIWRDNVYVTDWRVHAVFRLKTESEFRIVAEFGSRGSGMGQFNDPRQLSISANGDVYIADRGNDRIQILDSSLNPIREVTHPSIYRPWDVALTNEELCVLDSSVSSSVHIFTHTGKKIRSLTLCNDVIPLRYYFFCLDSNNRLVISDFVMNQIKFFSLNEGTLLHTLGEKGSQAGKFNLPTGLAPISNHKLVTLSWSDNNRLQIFSPF